MVLIVSAFSSSSCNCRSSPSQEPQTLTNSPHVQYSRVTQTSNTIPAPLFPRLRASHSKFRSKSSILLSSHCLKVQRKLRISCKFKLKFKSKSLCLWIPPRPKPNLAFTRLSLSKPSSRWSRVPPTDTEGGWQKIIHNSSSALDWIFVEISSTYWLVTMSSDHRNSHYFSPCLVTGPVCPI